MLRTVIREAGTAAVMDEEYPSGKVSHGAVREIRAVTDLQRPRRPYWMPSWRRLASASKRRRRPDRRRRQRHGVERLVRDALNRQGGTFRPAATRSGIGPSKGGNADTLIRADQSVAKRAVKPPRPRLPDHPASQPVEGAGFHRTARGGAGSHGRLAAPPGGGRCRRAALLAAPILGARVPGHRWRAWSEFRRLGQEAEPARPRSA